MAHHFRVLHDFGEEARLDVAVLLHFHGEVCQHTVQHVVRFRHQPRHPFVFRFVVLHHAGQEQVLLVRENLVERPFRHGERVGDVVHGYVLDALRVEQPGGHFNHLRACGVS